MDTTVCSQPVQVAETLKTWHKLHDYHNPKIPRLIKYNLTMKTIDKYRRIQFYLIEKIGLYLSH